MSKQLTIQEAKEQGYKYASLEFDEVRLIPLDECKPSKSYVLMTKEGSPLRFTMN